MATPMQQVQQVNPLGGTNWSGNTVTTTYDPRILQDFWNQSELRQGQRDMWGRAAGLAAGSMEVDPRTGLPAVGQQPIQTGYDRSGMANIPGATDFGGERQRVEDSMYDRFANRADRRFGQARTALESQLRDQGFTPGAEGWDEAMQTFGEGETDAYAGAARDAIAAGGAEQSRMLADALRIRGQQGSEAQQDLGNWNAGQGTSFAQQFATRGQQFGENIGAGDLSRSWLATTQQGAPQGTMLPNFDLGLTGIDEDQASRNAWYAGLESFLGPILTGALTPTTPGGSSPAGNIASQIPGWLARIPGLFGGDGAMNPEDAYGPGSGWGEDVMPGGDTLPWTEDDPFGVGGWEDFWGSDDPFGIGGW